jgi:hypothetical protein
MSYKFAKNPDKIGYFPKIYTHFMKKILTVLSVLSIFSHTSFAQNVGIGNSTPIAKLEVSAADSNVAMLTNSSLPLDSVKTRLYFRNNEFYTGAIGTHITQGSSDGSSIYSRLGFYTFATSSASGLKERLSITDGGNVGINHLSPNATLDVVNLSTTPLSIRGTTNSTIAATVTGGTAGVTGEVTSLTPGAFAAGVRGVNRGTSGNGVGVLGYHAGTGWGIFGNSAAGVGVLGSTTSGIGGYFTAGASGVALSTSGDVKMAGIGEGVGKVLTSDASGNATWQTPATINKIGFSAYLTSNTTVGTSGAYFVTGFTKYFEDGGNNLNVSTGIYTVPVAGTYLFKARTSFNSTSVAGSTSYLARIYINLFGGGTKIEQTQIAQPNISGYGSTTEVTAIVKCNAGDQVHMESNHSNAFSMTLSGGTSAASTTFSGSLLY